MENIKGTDIYLLDQIMKGRYLPHQKILDAGCGRGRNMRWFALNNYNVVGCDTNADMLQESPPYTGLPSSAFKVAAIENMPYGDAEFDHVICNAVLHFAESPEHFLDMMREMHRVLKPRGILFIRMTSKFGLPENYTTVGNGRYLQQDGYERFLLTKDLLNQAKTNIGFEQLEPVKSILVEELRSMTTLVLRKL
jgi:ubiquinone/menaquinone biosynthesis C-methylase UbiE